MCTSMPNCYVSALGIVVLKEQCSLTLPRCDRILDLLDLLDLSNGATGLNLRRAISTQQTRSVASPTADHSGQEHSVKP